MEEIKNIKYVLKKFMEKSWEGVYHSELWHIANGGYDCWFELYRDGIPMANCVAGDVSAWGFSNEDKNDELCQLIVDTMPALKKINRNETLTALPKQKFGYIVEDINGDDSDELFIVRYECVYDEDNIIYERDTNNVEVIADNKNIDEHNFEDYIHKLERIYLEDKNGEFICELPITNSNFV